MGFGRPQAGTQWDVAGNLRGLVGRLRDGIAWRFEPAWQRRVHAAMASDSAFVPALVGLMNRLRPADSPEVQQLPLEWLDLSSSCTRQTRVPECIGISVGPHLADARTLAVHLPAVTVSAFLDAAVHPDSSSVWVKGHGLVIERVVSTDASRCHYAGGFIVGHGERTAVVKRFPAEHIERGVFLGGNGSFNYYHWLVELLPKLAYLDAGDEEMPLLVSEMARSIPSFSTALDAVAGRRTVITLRRDRLYEVGHLLYVNAPNTCPFNLRPRHTMQVGDFRTRPAALEFVRRRLLEGLPVRADSVASSRIFLGRRSSRRSYNQDEIFALFEPHGFRMVHMEDMSLAEQCEAVRNAEMIAGPTGAAWTNLLFARPGTRCLCWMADDSAGFAAYSNLAHHVGAKLRYVTYPVRAESTDELYRKDYRVAPADVATALHRLLHA
jgi:hypothetical protein